LCYGCLRMIDALVLPERLGEGWNSGGKGFVCMPRQQVAFLRKCRKIKGCGSLKEDFYTKFKPILRNLGYDVAEK